TEGISNTIVYEAITQTNQQITISTYQYAAALLNAVVQAQSKYNDRKALADKMGYALVRGMETTVSALFNAGFSQTVGTYGGDTDDSTVRRAWQYIADAGFADDGDCSFVFSPGATASLFGQDRFASKDFVDGNAIEKAQLPAMYGFTAYRSNLLNSPNSGQHDSALFHRSAVILVRQVKPTAKTQYRIEYNADAMLMYDLYASAVAQQPNEAPTTASGGAGSSETETIGNYGAVQIKGI
ncbi:MAG: hypothetical protein ACRETD_14760, partial [Steroidobacteraceae bacterium]